MMRAVRVEAMARTIAGAIYSKGPHHDPGHSLVQQIAYDAAAIIDELDRLEAEHDKAERERAGQYAGPENIQSTCAKCKPGNPCALGYRTGRDFCSYGKQHPETGPEMYTRLSENPGENAAGIQAALDLAKRSADYPIGPG